MRNIKANKLHSFCICLALAVITFIAFEQVCQSDFIDYDDNTYVTENPQVINGLTRESVLWAFSTPHGNTSYWHPLTWLSHMLDCELFGLNPFWHHITSLLFHIANTLLLFFLLSRMTRAVWASAFVAAFFALHPIHVESVAWIAERKDVLSCFFWMLTLISYMWYARQPCMGRYLLTVFLFVLGLMSKPMVVTLPFVLLLLDYWPMERLRRPDDSKRKISASSRTTETGYQKATLRRLIGEKVPLFVLSAVLGTITFLAQRSLGGVVSASNLPLSIRISNALISYVSYLGKMIYPSHLAVLYPHSYTAFPLWQSIAGFLVLAVISALVFCKARRYRYLVVGWLWYLGTLLPVIGFVQVGSQAMADRYTYIPAIGIFIMVTWAAAELLAKWRYRKVVLGISAVLILTAILVRTRMQVCHWQNSLKLFGHTIKVTENNFIMHNNYGKELLKRGRFEEAVAEFREALRIYPDFADAHGNLADALARQGKLAEAVAHFKQTLRLEPDRVGIMNNLAWILATTEDEELRDSTEAVNMAKRACDLTNYKNPIFMDTLATAYAANGRFSEAVNIAERALELALSPQQKQVADQIRKHLNLFKSGQPFIESLPQPVSN